MLLLEQYLSVNRRATQIHESYLEENGKMLRGSIEQFIKHCIGGSYIPQIKVSKEKTTPKTKCQNSLMVESRRLLETKSPNSKRWK